MNLLISGFEPFGELSVNPTQVLAEKAQEWEVEGVNIHTVVLPVVYHACARRLIDEIERVNPDVVLSLGVAVGRSSITPERIGVNLQDTVGEGKLGDNAGQKPKDEKLYETGPDGIFSTLPNRFLVNALKEAGIPAQISNTAGAYICNNTLYEMLVYLKNESSEIKAGFIHVPATPEMVTASSHLPSMALETQEKALKMMITTLRDSLT
ncbi:pyroglutamyl-peptidase I [Alteribacter populi]|uniref:pyroglutamyl-peptidase I n=1 Tax=Alteribacter populi TaxID=2011011 RepID=UPI000BBA65BF|nr:pyroglutamyl-peptidase I [Alteribacter populi]